MTDTPGLPSTVGIEAVECVADGLSGVTVRVTGRWPRRRPEWRGPAMLVIEIGGRRHRVPAMPEPPSLGGALPGTWRMSFSVPAELAGHLSGHTWLALGAVMVPLSLPDVPPSPADAPRPAPPPPHGPPEPRSAPPSLVSAELLAARELRSLEVAAESARRRAAEADARAAGLEAEIARLQRELSEARTEPERLRAEIQVRERELVDAHQRLHSEIAERQQAEERLAEQHRLTSLQRERAADLTERRHELERELRRLARAADEARHEAAAARAELARVASAPVNALPEPAGPPVLPTPAVAPPTEVPSPGPPPPVQAGGPPGPADPAVLRREAGLAQTAGAPEAAAVARPWTAPPHVHRQTLEEELGWVARRTRALGRPLPPVDRAKIQLARVALGADLEAARAREEAVRAELQEAVGRLASAQAALEAARAELAEARAGQRAGQRTVAALEAELARQRERSASALRAIAEFRAELAEFRATPLAPEREPEESTHPPADARSTPAEPPRPPDGEAATPRPPDGEAETPPIPENAVQPERLSAALERLRERHPPAANQSAAPGDAPLRLELPARPAPDAVPALFRSLARTDPAAAGRLLLGLLPAHHLVHPRPLAYDLVLAPAQCLQVTVGEDSTQAVAAASPRPPARTQFRVDGTAAELARWLAAGPLRRKLGRRHLARQRGDRRGRQALRELTGTPLHLAAVVNAGAALEPGLAFHLVALAIAEPAGAAGESFVLAHRPAQSARATAALTVQPGSPPWVTEIGLDLPATGTVICPPEALLGALLGGAAEIVGDPRPVALIRDWIERA